jgi:predicted N-acetyltransferase YhbS
MGTLVPRRVVIRAKAGIFQGDGTGTARDLDLRWGDNVDGQTRTHPPIPLAISYTRAKGRGPEPAGAPPREESVTVIDFVPLSTVPLEAVEALLDHAFGTDRHGRTAYKIRGDGAALPALSIGAIDSAVLIGTVQCWPILLHGDDGHDHALVMIGPVAVAPDRQRDGLGRRLMTAALDAAAACGEDGAMMLIGDPEYYGRFFGFTAARTAGWRLPGPVERHRLLARGDRVPAVAGLLGPPVATPVA